MPGGLWQAFDVGSDPTLEEGQKDHGIHPTLWSTPLTNCMLQLQDLVGQRAFPPPHLSILWI